MGQQQLILLILVTVIIGIAITVGMTSIKSGHEQSTRDLMYQRVLEAQNLARAHYLKPISMDGGGQSFENITLRNIGLPAQSEDGMYDFSIGDRNSGDFQLIITPRFNSPTIIASLSLNGIEWSNEE